MVKLTRTVSSWVLSFFETRFLRFRIAILSSSSSAHSSANSYLNSTMDKFRETCKQIIPANIQQIFIGMDIFRDTCKQITPREQITPLEQGGRFGSPNFIGNGFPQSVKVFIV